MTTFGGFGGEALKMRFFSKTKRANEVRPGMAMPCLEWQACRQPTGYGQLGIGSRADGSRRNEFAHRLAWELVHGPIPDGLCVLHKCDNPPCVDVDHLFLGTDADNVADMIAKGRDRKACGEASGARLHPESMARVGDRNGSRLHPESRPRGDAHWFRLHPERMPHFRGENHGGSKLTECNVGLIFQLRAQGWSQRKLATEFGVCNQQISRILARKRWAHVESEAKP